MGKPAHVSYCAGPEALIKIRLEILFMSAGTEAKRRDNQEKEFLNAEFRQNSTRVDPDQAVLKAIRAGLPMGPCGFLSVQVTSGTFLSLGF